MRVVVDCFCGVSDVGSCGIWCRRSAARQRTRARVDRACRRVHVARAGSRARRRSAGARDRSPISPKSVAEARRRPWRRSPRRSSDRLPRTHRGSAGRSRQPSARRSARAASGAKAAPACDNPDAHRALARTVEIDTTGGPAFGTEHFKQYDFLRDKEVVLTFDDGPWPDNTPMVIKALTDNCIKATFFEIGEHATWRPEIIARWWPRPA